MGTYEDLKAAIQQVIRTNGNNEITGALLQQTLLSIVNSVGTNAAFAGIATPDTNPGTSDQNVFYLATEAGTYVNFGGIEIAEGEAVILNNKTGNWTKTTSGFATQQQLTELGSRQGLINAELESKIGAVSIKIAPIINTTKATRGVTYTNTIYGDFKKNDVVFVRADWDSTTNANNSVAVLGDYSAESISYIANHVLTKLVIPQNTSYLQINMNQSLIIGDGDISFSVVEQLYLNSNDYYFPLINGGLKLDGDIFENSQRKTTGVILNNRPLYIQVADGYSVSYLYGDNPTELFDGGYIINGINRDAMLDVNAKYVGFTILKVSSAFIEDDDCRLIICKSNSTIENIAENVKELQVSIKGMGLFVDKLVYKVDINNSIKIVNGATWADGIIHEVSGRRTTGVIKIDKPVKISIPKGYNVAVMVGENPTGLTDLGYIINDGGEYIISGYNYMAVNIVINANNYQTDFPSDNNIGLIISDADSFISELVDRTNPIDVITTQLILEQFKNTTAISDSKELIAVSDAFDINDFGLYCAGMVAAENAIGEYGSPTWNAYLLMANLADIEKTKTQILCYAHEKLSGLGEIESVQHGMAKWTGEDEITTIFQVIYRPYIGNSINDNLQYSSFVTRKFRPSTKEWEMPVVADINVLGTIYELSNKSQLVNDTWQPMQSQIDAINAIWTATGIEHPSRWESEEYSYNWGNNFFAYNNEWYAVICLGAMSHTLCKSSDLIHWTFVCDIPFGQISLEEACVCIYKDKVYAMSRGENQSAEQGGDGQDSKIMYCSFSTLSQSVQDWSVPVILNGCHRERPTIAALNDKLYIMQGTGERAYTENKGIARGIKILIVMDLALNVLAWNRLQFTYPLLHPQFMNYGGNLMMSVSSDKRCLGWTKGGDTRSEISVGHLNEYILGL